MKKLVIGVLFVFAGCTAAAAGVALEGAAAEEGVEVTDAGVAAAEDDVEAAAGVEGGEVAADG